MAALLHCIVVDIENSRLKDHIRDWNTNMKVDMYNHFKKKFKEEREKRDDLLDSVFGMIEMEYKNLRDWVVCEECECFMNAETEGHSISVCNDEWLYTCKDCINK